MFRYLILIHYFIQVLHPIHNNLNLNSMTATWSFLLSLIGSDGKHGDGCELFNSIPMLAYWNIRSWLPSMENIWLFFKSFFFFFLYLFILHYIIVVFYFYRLRLNRESTKKRKYRGKMEGKKIWRKIKIYKVLEI